MGFPFFEIPDAPAPAGAIVGTDLGTICTAAASAIVAGFRVGGLPIAARAVNLALDRRPYPDQVPQVLVIPESQRPDAAVVAGGGRHTPKRDGQVTVVVIDRKARDKVDTANYLLAGPAGFYTSSLAQLDEILTTRWLLDADGNSLTIEPLELVGGGFPRAYGDSFEFYGCEWTWSVTWVQALTVASGE